MLRGCSIILEECERIRLKLKKRIAKQEEKRKAEFDEIFSYRSVDEICDAYGYGLITDNQRRKYIELFEKGKEALDEPLESKNTALWIFYVDLLSNYALKLSRIDLMHFLPKNRQKKSGVLKKV